MNQILSLQKMPVEAAGYLDLGSDASVKCSSYSTGGCTITSTIL